MARIKFKVWQDWSGPRTRRHRPRYAILVGVLLLVAIGALVQFTISPGQVAQLVARTGAEPWGGENSFFYRHLLSIFIGLIALLVGLKLHLRHWFRFSPWILTAGLALAAVTGLSGSRWLIVAGNSIQPVEIVKLGLILVFAGLVLRAGNQPGRSVKDSLWANRFSLGLLILTGLMIGFLQGDLGSVIVIAAAAGAILLVSGLSWQTVTTLMVTGLAAIVNLILIAPYRWARVTTFFSDSGADCLAQGYHICQALIAIGSGGFWGRGFGRSVQVFGYLPETINDSIFAIYAEIAGFFGAVILLGLFFWLFRTVYRQILRLEPALALVLTGLLTWLVCQSLINIGSMLDLLPMKGITLPFISFGGSSLVMVMLAAGLILQITGYSYYSDREAKTRVSQWQRWWIWWGRYNRKRQQQIR